EQQTAYVVPKWLEVRRVLFRSQEPAEVVIDAVLVRREHDGADLVRWDQYAIGRAVDGANRVGPLKVNGRSALGDLVGARPERIADRKSVVRERGEEWGGAVV